MKIVKSTDKYFFFLDYLRVFACISVIIGHKFNISLLEALNSPALKGVPDFMLSILALFIHGGAAVVLFFLVSGYVISYVLYNDSTIDFLVKRIFRIYPLYMFAVLVQYSLLKMHNPDYEIIPSELIIQLLLLGDFFDAPYTLAGVEWTLRVEICFYLFMVMVRYFMPNGLGGPWFIPLLFGLTVLAATLPAIPSAPFLFNNYLLLAIPFPLVGSAFYLLETRKMSLLEFLIFVSTVLLFCWYGSKYDKFFVYEDFIYYGTLGIGIFALAWKFRSIFSANKLILLLSELTYAIYLFHNWLLEHFKIITDSIWTAFVLLALACYLAHLFVEKPMFGLGKWLLRKWRSFTIKASC